MVNPIRSLAAALGRFLRELDRGLDVMHGVREPGRGHLAAPFGTVGAARDGRRPSLNGRVGEA